MSECVICQGSEFVRLPVYRRVSARYADAPVPLSLAAEEAYRTYPCPECNEKTAAEEKVSTLYATESVRNYGDENFDMQPVVTGNLARAISNKLLKDNMVEIVKEKRGDETLFIAKIGVVAPRTFQRIEARALDKMTEFLRGVTSAASHAISVWGSQYSGDDGPISKGMAIRFMREAFNRHIDDTKEKIETSYKRQPS
jgi:hypothetical protein